MGQPRHMGRRQPQLGRIDIAEVSRHYQVVPVYLAISEALQATEKWRFKLRNERGITVARRCP
jgi:hypothetical protein